MLQNVNDYLGFPYTLGARWYKLKCLKINQHAQILRRICYNLTAVDISQTDRPVPSSHCTWWWKSFSGSCALGACSPSYPNVPADPSSEPEITPVTYTGGGVKFWKAPMQRGFCYSRRLWFNDKYNQIYPCPSQFLFCYQLYIHGYLDFPNIKNESLFEPKWLVSQWVSLHQFYLCGSTQIRSQNLKQKTWPAIYG